MSFEFPKTPEGLTKEESAMILTTALRLSNIENRTELEKVTGLHRSCLYDYFNARSIPPQERWELLREKLFVELESEVEPENKLTSSVSEKVKINEDNLKEINNHCENMKVALFLLMEELKYFKDSSSQSRKIMKKNINGEEVGYLVSLLSSLFDENELEIFKAFTNE